MKNKKILQNKIKRKKKYQHRKKFYSGNSYELHQQQKFKRKKKKFHTENTLKQHKKRIYDENA